MRYRLIVVTHGGDETTPMLRSTLASFEEMVTPSPFERILIEDGTPKLGLKWSGARLGWRGSVGFCKTAEMAWMAAATPGVDWVYWLEHDFVHLRPVHLEDLCDVLGQHDEVAQMSLMRQPVSNLEIREGCVIAPQHYAPRISQSRKHDGRLHWLEHGRYWTTNPSLFRSSTALAHAWPEGSECEGRHTISLRSAGYSFGIWGEGEAWVHHVGERTGFGY